MADRWLKEMTGNFLRTGEMDFGTTLGKYCLLPSVSNWKFEEKIARAVDIRTNSTGLDRYLRLPGRNSDDQQNAC